jgi:Rap1a immunity proteins
MRHAVLFALAIPAVAAAAPYPYTLSGDRFVKMMSSPDPTGYEHLQREKAYSYLDGVRDGAEGSEWCDLPHQLKTPDLAYELADDIAKLPAAERKRNAAVLLRQQLARRYPCRNGGKQ